MKLPNDEYANLDVTDAQMFRLSRILKAQGVIRFLQEFWDAIGVLKQNARNIKNGSQHFTPAQILAAGTVYNVNLNWVFGLEKELYRGLRYTREMAAVDERLNGREANKSGSKQPVTQPKN